MSGPLVVHTMMLAGILFAFGLIGFLARRNVLFMLMSVEVMLNAAGLGFIAAGARWGQADGQIMFMFILTLAAAEVPVALALVLQVHRRIRTLDADAVTLMAG